MIKSTKIYIKLLARSAIAIRSLESLFLIFILIDLSFLLFFFEKNSTDSSLYNNFYKHIIDQK